MIEQEEQNGRFGRFDKTSGQNWRLREIIEQLYFRTYGEHLPEDFFRR